MKYVRALAWLSGMVSVTAAGAAAVSPWRSIHVRVRASMILSSVEGGLRVLVWTAPEERERASPPAVRFEEPPRPYEFVWGFRKGGVAGSMWWVMAPMWAVVPVSALPMGVVIARAVVRRRRGACQECGYDLRGVSGAVCPECGSELKPRSRSAS